MFVYHLFLPVFYVCMYVYILSYFVNKLEMWWLYLSPIEKKKELQSALLNLTVSDLWGQSTNEYNNNIYDVNYTNQNRVLYYVLR